MREIFAKHRSTFQWVSQVLIATPIVVACAEPERSTSALLRDGGPDAALSVGGSQDSTNSADSGASDAGTGANTITLNGVNEVSTQAPEGGVLTLEVGDAGTVSTDVTGQTLLPSVADAAPSDDVDSSIEVTQTDDSSDASADDAETAVDAAAVSTSTHTDAEQVVSSGVEQTSDTDAPTTSGEQTNAEEVSAGDELSSGELSSSGEPSSSGEDEVSTSVDADAGPPNGTPNKLGVIALTQQTVTVAGIGTFDASGIGGNFNATTAREPSNCENTTLGSCYVVHCDGVPDTDDTPATLYNAGVVTVSGLSEDVPIDWQDSFSGYQSPAYDRLLWSGSEVVTLDVEGTAMVPGFTQDLTLPTPIDLTVDLDSFATLTKSTDLVVTWAGGIEGLVQVNLTEVDSANGDTVLCTVDATDGTIAIPPSVLQEVSGETSLTIGIFTVEERLVEDWQMLFQASMVIGGRSITVE